MGSLVGAWVDDGCPDRETLVAFDLGKLPAADLAAVAGHLAVCRRCEEALLDIQGGDVGDSLLARLKHCLAGPPPSGGPTDSGLEALAAMALGTAPWEGTAPNESDLGFDLDADADAADHAPFGHYERLGKLGEGGMGVVYLARRPPFKRRVALKTIAAGRQASRQNVARFFREVEAVSGLQHPNVVQVYDCGEYDGVPYYTMELMEGGTLESEIKAGPLSPAEAAGIVRTLAAAVQHVHQANIVHRDLKSANVLRAGDGTFKVADFGLARLLDVETAEAPTAFRTEPDAVLGTPGFMAPEQAACQPADRPADVYALGAILYHALTGRPPFVGPKAEVLRLVRTTPPRRPSAFRPGIPFALELICLKCLEKKPAARYLSAQALADDLDRWLRGESPRDTPGWFTRAGRSVLQHKTAAVASLVFTAVGVPLIPAGTNAYLNNPARIVGRLKADLARGWPVTLIGETGGPIWSRWMFGRPAGPLEPPDGQTLTIDTWSLSLLELLPDPGTDRYRFRVQVRHEKSELPGAVGLYFARRSYVGERGVIESFTQVAFNDVRGDKERLERIPPEHRLRTKLRDNSVQMIHRLAADGLSGDAFMLGGVAGPWFKPHGELNGIWHDLEVTVTPELVTASWDGQPFSTNPVKIQEDLKILPSLIRPANSPVPQEFVPRFSPRGGLGLYLWKGSASFRAASVTPL
jgi:serine/threonine-protein kinase